MMNNSLVFMNFNSYVSISLPRYCPWFYEICRLVLV